MPSKAIENDIPFSRWYGGKPSYEIFHPFGAKCYAFVPVEKRPSTFSPTSIMGIFVGYEPFHKAYRCYIPELNDIVISANVSFQDKIFPFKDGTVIKPESVSQKDIMFFHSHLHSLILS